MRFELLLDVMDRFLNLRDTNTEILSYYVSTLSLQASNRCAHLPESENHTVPYGTALLGGAVPGTSCQATIVPSLRDISQQALVS